MMPTFGVINTRRASAFINQVYRSSRGVALLPTCMQLPREPSLPPLQDVYMHSLALACTGDTVTVGKEVYLTELNG